MGVSGGMAAASVVSGSLALQVRFRCGFNESAPAGKEWADALTPSVASGAGGVGELLLFLGQARRPWQMRVVCFAAFCGSCARAGSFVDLVAMAAELAFSAGDGRRQVWRGGLWLCAGQFAQQGVLGVQRRFRPGGAAGDVEILIYAGPPGISKFVRTKALILLFFLGSEYGLLGRRPCGLNITRSPGACRVRPVDRAGGFPVGAVAGVRHGAPAPELAHARASADQLSVDRCGDGGGLQPIKSRLRYRGRKPTRERRGG